MRENTYTNTNGPSQSADTRGEQLHAGRYVDIDAE